MDYETYLVHGDEEHDSVVAPIYQTSTFRAPSPEIFAQMAAQPRHERFYTRYGNPTLAAAEALLARLEGAESALVTASGMGAMTAAVLAHVRAGDHVVAQGDLYGGTRGLLARFLPRFGVEVTFVDQASNEAFTAAMRPGTTLVVLETPSNPLLRLTDLAAVCGLAREHGARSIVDNTFASPINQRPLEFGADLVVHSATKVLNGHSDVVAGAVAGSTENVERVWNSAVVLGATLGPFDAWLLVRGLRTLALRVERHNRSAERIAAFLGSHAGVRNVYYPGLPSHPQHDLAKRQMRGFGGVLSFDVRGGAQGAREVFAALRLPQRAASVGGVESLIVHPAAMWSGVLEPDELESAGIGPSLLRLSVGLEAVEDLVEDLDRALATVAGRSG